MKSSFQLTRKTVAENWHLIRNQVGFFWNRSVLFGGIRFVCVPNTRVIIDDSVEENTLERKEMLQRICTLRCSI